MTRNTTATLIYVHNEVLHKLYTSSAVCYSSLFEDHVMGMACNFYVWDHKFIQNFYWEI